MRTVGQGECQPWLTIRNSGQPSEPEGFDASTLDEGGPATPPADSDGADLARRAGKLDWSRKSIAPTARMIADVQRQFASNRRLMQSIYESTRFVDRMMPQLIKPFELALRHRDGTGRLRLLGALHGARRARGGLPAGGKPLKN